MSFHCEMIPNYFKSTSFLRTLVQRTRGKFSNSSLKKKIGEFIDNQKAIENISEKELLKSFEDFWNGIIKNSEILEFRRNIEITKKEQMYKYRHDLKKAFETCFESDQVDIVAKQEFEDFKSIEDWKFTEAQFRKIKIEDERYCHKDLLKRILSALTSFMHSMIYGSSKHLGLMPQILSLFKRQINENPYTKRNFDGFADNKVIHKLCSEFNDILLLELTKYDQLEKCVTPLFKVHVVGFACFKLLLPRLQENLNFYQMSKDPVSELNAEKNHFENLYRCKLQGAKQSFFWEQKLTKILLELIVEILLNPVGSQETHDLIYKFIHNSGTDGNRNDYFINNFH